MPRESHGQWNLAGYSPMGHKESDMTEWLTLCDFKNPFLLIYIDFVWASSGPSQRFTSWDYLGLWVAIWSSSDQWNFNKGKSLDALLFQFSSVSQSCPNLCKSMDCSTPGFPSPTLGVYSNSCPSSWWCYLIISSSVTPFFFCLQPFPASGFFPVSQLFASDGHVWSWIHTVVLNYVWIFSLFSSEKTPSTTSHEDAKTKTSSLLPTSLLKEHCTWLNSKHT